MYNKTRKELIKEICNRLNSKGFKDFSNFVGVEDFSTSSTFGSSIKYLPMENLIKMYECSIDSCSCFKEAYQLWGRSGILKFQPYMVDTCGNPSLVLRHNRYLHMFRGYRFQVSATVDGITECRSGSYSTTFLTDVPYYRKILTNGLVSYMLWWAALIDVGFCYDNFVTLFNENRNIIEEFLKTSINYWGGPKDFNWSDIEPYIKIEKGNIDTINRNVFQLKNDSTVEAYLAIGSKTIQIETEGSNLVTITIPELSEKSGYDLTDDDAYEDYNYECECLKRHHYVEMFTVMALKLAGIHMSFTNYYFMKNRKSRMRPINKPGVINVATLNDIHNVIPDEF